MSRPLIYPSNRRTTCPSRNSLLSLTLFWALSGCSTLPTEDVAKTGDHELTCDQLTAEIDALAGKRDKAKGTADTALGVAAAGAALVVIPMIGPALAAGSYLITKKYMDASEAQERRQYLIRLHNEKKCGTVTPAEAS